jgi:hypothetical protein
LPTGWTVIVIETVAGDAGTVGADLAARAIVADRARVDNACALDAALSRLAISIHVAVIGRDTTAFDTVRLLAAVGIDCTLGWLVGLATHAAELVDRTGGAGRAGRLALVAGP